jgi:phosphatidate cytidylyltransferase
MFYLLDKTGLNPYRLTVLVFGLALLAAVTFAGGLTVYVFAVFAAIVVANAVFRRDNAGALKNTGATILSFLYPGVFIAFLIATGMMEFGRVYLIVLFLAIWAADTGAYFVGTAFGKHSLAPKISPKKSIEGLVGGAVACTAVIIIIRLIWPDVAFDYVWGLILAVILIAGSVFGDLAESAFKRDAGVKDSGGILPGHGGILDRFDGIFVCAPLMFLFVQIYNFLALR